MHAAAPYYSVLIRVPPDNPASTTEFVCDLCTEMPKPTDGGKTYTFKIREGVKFHDGSKLTAQDVATSWNYIVFPPKGVSSARVSYYEMVDKIEAPDDTTVVFRLKRATTAFLPALADPYTWIYKKEILEKDPHWFEKNIMGSGPFKFVAYEVGQSIKGVRNPDYYHKGLPYLDAIVGIFADKQSVRVDALRADRAAIEFRGLPPSARDQLVKEAGTDIVGAGQRLELRQHPDAQPARRSRSTTCACAGRWRSPSTSGRARRRWPRSPMSGRWAASSSRARRWRRPRRSCSRSPGFWPDIEKSRAEARRLLKEAGAEGLKFELLNRNVDQPYKFVGTWAIGEWKKIGLNVEQKVVPTGPWFSNMRAGTFDVAMEANCQSVVNPVLDTGKYLPHTVYPGELRRLRRSPSRSSSTRRCRPRPIPRSSATTCAPSRSTRSTPWCTRSCCRTGTASFWRDPTSRAGRSAPATT